MKCASFFCLYPIAFLLLLFVLSPSDSAAQPTAAVSFVTRMDFPVGQDRTAIAAGDSIRRPVGASPSPNLSFVAVREYLVDHDPAALATGDLNGDGKIDVVSLNATSNPLVSNDVTVLLG